MTMRQRLWAFARGKEHDRVPFAQYRANAGPEEEIWAEIGRDAMGVLECFSFNQMAAPNCTFTYNEIFLNGKKGFRNTLTTPVGTLQEERLVDPVLGSSAASSHYVKEPEDYQVLMAHFEDMRPRLTIDPIHRIIRDLGDDGVPHPFISRTPYQQLWVQWVNIQDLAVHMALSPELMNDVFSLMERKQTEEFRMIVRAVSEVPVPYLAFGDNITAPMIGENLFREHCLPAYNELAGLLGEAGLDIPIYVHMDGDLKPLWDAVGDTRVRGLDSMSPSPDNDTTVADAITRWPEMRVCINFPSSVHLTSPMNIYNHTCAFSEQGGHTGRLQIQISENVPPGIWRTSFPPILKAIQEFGAPAN